MYGVKNLGTGDFTSVPSIAPEILKADENNLQLTNVKKTLFYHVLFCVDSFSP